MNTTDVIYFLLAILFMVSLKFFFPGNRRSRKPELCEVSGHDRVFPPSSPHPLIHILTPPIDHFCPAKPGLWETTQVHRKYGLRSPVLRKNLCASLPAEVQVPVLQYLRKVCVQRILWTCTRQVTPRLFLDISSTDDSPATQRCRPARSRATMCGMQNATSSDRRFVFRV